MSPVVRGAVHGAIAGLNGAACMSVVREAARRAGLVDAMPPQVVREALSGRAGSDPRGIDPHVGDHAVHLAIGIVAGGAYGTLAARRARPSLTGGIVWGAGVWAAGLLALLPIFGRRRAHVHTELPQSAVNLATHLVYGALLALLIQGMDREDARRASRADRHVRKVG